MNSLCWRCAINILSTPVNFTHLKIINQLSQLDQRCVLRRNALSNKAVLTLTDESNSIYQY